MSASTELTALLAVQDRDLAVDQMRYRREHLPERAALDACETETAAIDSGLSELEARAKQVRVAQQDAENQAASLGTRIENLDKQMYAGTVTAAKDLQAMAHEIESLKHRRSDAEEMVLEAMESQDLVDAERDSLMANREALVLRSEELTAALAESERAVDGEIEMVLAARSDLAAGLPGELLSRYESLRARLGGVAVARLTAGRCEGCHLTLPSMALDQIRHAPAGTVSTCEECGRILVPA